MPVSSLTPAQRQIVEIAKAIHREARLVIMDEPTAPLTLHEVEKLYEVIRELKSRAIAVIYISHRLEEVFAVCDRVSVMRDGRYIRTAAVNETNRKELIGLMVGREFDGAYPRHAEKPGKVALEVRNVRGKGVSGVSFSVRSGEILGVSGLVGAGRSELMRLIYGAEKLEAGEILIDGTPMRIASPSDALRLGIGLIPEDRKRHGAFLGRSIAWNIAIASLRRISRLGVVRGDREADQAHAFSEKLRIKAPSIRQKVSALSGGNQQKVVLAKTLAARTRIIIFDEPTRGIDIGAREEIYRLMCELAENGTAIIMVSSDMEELLGISDRLIVLADGRLVGEMQRSEFNPHRVLELAAGGKTTEVSA
jgi:ribose transport system ATP-binding protein